MIRTDQSDFIIKRISAKRPIFKMENQEGFNFLENQQKFVKSRELIQKQLLANIQKQIPLQETDPLQYGQRELKEVFTQLEEQLKTVYIDYLHNDESGKKQRKINREPSKHEDDSPHPKKQRVDKNKCRFCKQSTIPLIMNILKQNSDQEHSHFVTMKSIRQQILQHTAKDDKSDQKVPYIPFEYQEQIVICKRCRFKFHSECAKNVENINDWICRYCQNRIEELKSCNQWDYVNNKQIKPSDLRKIHHSLIDRIVKKKKIFTVEHIAPITPFLGNPQIRKFLHKYPLYKGQNGDIQYPVLESLAKEYPGVLNLQQKPKPYMINSEIVEQILTIQTAQQILFPQLPIPQNVTDDYVQKNFYELLMSLIRVYIDHLKQMNDFKDYNPVSSAYFHLLKFLIGKQESVNFAMLQKTWTEFITQIEELLDGEAPSYQADDLSVADQANIIVYLIEGLYDIDKMKKAIDSKDQSQPKQNALKGFYNFNPSCFANCSAYLGQDSEESFYFYFNHVPSSIFVKTRKGWGQLTLSDLPELMGSMTLHGINEANLHENLKQLSSINLNDHYFTPQKQIKVQNQLYYLELNEVIEFFIKVEEKLAAYLEKKGYYWTENRKFMLSKISEARNQEKVLEYFRKFLDGILTLQCKSKLVKSFKLFRFHFEIGNLLSFYVDNHQELAGTYVALHVLNLVIDQYLDFKKASQKKTKKQERLKELKDLKEQKEQKEQKDQQKHQLIQDQLGLAVGREKRENAGRKRISSPISDKKKVVCLKCLKNVSATQITRCSQCQSVFHQECINGKTKLCQNCQPLKSKQKK